MNTGSFLTLRLVGCVLALSLSLLQTSSFAQALPADASMTVSRVDQSMNPMSGTQAQIFGVERDATGFIGIRRIYSPWYATNPTLFTTDLQNIYSELASTGKSYSSGLSLSVTDLPYYDEYISSCTGTNCTPTSFSRMYGGQARSFCNGTVCTEAEHLTPGYHWFIKYVPSPDICPAGKHPFPDVTSIPCVLKSTRKNSDGTGGTDLKLESTSNIVGTCSLKTTYLQNWTTPYLVTPASAGQLSVSAPGQSILANTPAIITDGDNMLPNLLNCPANYVAMCSISDVGNNLCGCYFPHVPGETWATIKPSNFTCVDDPTTDWVDIPLSGTDSFDINAEYRYKVSSQGDFWFYPKEISARSLVSNESYFGQIFYVSADAKTSYQYNGNFLDTVVQIQKRALPSWTDVPLTGTDPFDLAYEYRFKMTVPVRPGVPTGDFWYHAKQVGAQSLVMDNGYGEITFVSAANKTAYLSRGTPTGITISQMQRRALTWNDVPLNTTEAYDVSCNYRFKMNYPASPQWRPGVPAGDFWHYPERTSAQSHIANANGGYQTFSVFANNKAVFDFNGVNNGAVLQMQKSCNVPAALACPAGQTKTIAPSSPLCIVRANVKAPQDTDFTLTGYDHLVGNCTLAASVPQAPQTPSSQITVTAGQQRTSWLQGSPWANQLDPLLTCPAGAVKKSCAFNSGTGPIGEIFCACYPAGVTPPATVVEPTYMCVANGCAEGQYWCNAENACKSAGQACNALCTVGTTVKWVDFSNLYTAAGNSGTVQMGGQNVLVSYTGQINMFGITGESQWNVANGNPVMFPNGVADNVPDQSDIIWTTGGGTTQHKVTFSKPVKDPVMVIYSIGWNRVEYQFDQPFTILKKTADVNKLANNTVEGVGGYVLLQFQGTFSEISFKIPILEFVYTYGTSGFNFGIPDVQACPSVTCNNNNTCETGESCNCGDCTNGGVDDKDQCGLTSTGVQMVCTKDKDGVVTTPVPTTQTLTLSGTSGNNNGLFQKIATLQPGIHVFSGSGISYNDGGGGTNMVFFSSVNYPDGWPAPQEVMNLIAPYGAATGACPETVSYQDPTRPAIVYAVKRGGCGNMPWTIPADTKVTSDKILYLYRVLVQSAVSGTIRVDSSPLPVAQVGACCPADLQWSSVQNKCAPLVVPDCAEGQYYCSSESVCKAAGATCSTVTCNNNSVCDANESCDCSDCNGKIDHCGLGSNGQQLYCAQDPSSQACYTDKFPYCLSSACLDGYKRDATTGLCVASGAATSSCQNITYPIKGNGFIKDNTPSITQYCTEKGFSSGTLVASVTSGAGTSAWNGTAWTFSASSQSYSKEIQCCGGTVGAPVCQSYTNVQAHGGYLHMAPPSITQYCSEAGYQYASLKEWYMESGSLRIWNGTAWYEDITGGAVKNMQCCNNAVPVVTPAAPSSGPQVGACCPAGSAWNSLQSKCVPLDCAAGQYWCPLTGQCLAKGTSCGDDTDGGGGNQCNNNNTCEANEGCGCSDCAGQQDHCAAGLICEYGGDSNQKQSQCVDACTNTQAPSELKAGIDQPYISCTGNGDATKTHFRYKIIKTAGSTETDFVSTIPALIGTQMLHPTLTQGNYRVECYYGTMSELTTTLPAAAHSCTKSINVKASDDATAQGCGDIYAHKGNESSINEITSPTSYDAYYRCANRVVAPSLSQPFKLRVGSASPVVLGYDADMTNFLATLWNVGSISTQSGPYTIPLGTTPVECAVKIGGGYSTNNSCRINACAGAACSTPKTFIVLPSTENTCTTDAASGYRLGCNPTAADYSTCINRMQTALAGNPSATFPMTFQVGGVDREVQVTCTTVKPADAINDLINCTVQLPTSNNKISIFTGEFGSNASYQSLENVITQDTTDPTAAISYYTDYDATTPVVANPSATTWFNKPVTAKVVCNNIAGGSDTESPTDACMCASQILGSTAYDSTWTTQMPVGDTTTYYKTFTTSTSGGATWYVADTANNKSPAIALSSIRIDTDSPVLNGVPTSTGAATSRTVTFGFQDALSGISSIKYIKGVSATTTTSLFDNNCDASGATPVSLSGSATSEQPMVVSGFNTTTEKIAYCIKDNAGNMLRGTYPNQLVGCFSATNLSPVPRIDTYSSALISRITSATPQYGYGLTESTANAACFRGIIAANVSTYVSNQYSPVSVAGSGVTLDWASPAFIKNSTTTRNANGYYYSTPASGLTTAPLLTINDSPALDATNIKTVVAEGVNIQINSNITYSASGRTLVIIAKKNSGGMGGNIFIAPSVTRIDAILIADGTLQNGVAGVSKNWIDNAADVTNRLTINGRIYALNTRGGSLISSSGTLQQAGIAQGKYFDATANIVSTTTNITSAAMQDLERFRYISDDGNAQCSLHVNYLSLATNALPQILTRPSGFSGTCNF